MAFNSLGGYVRRVTKVASLVTAVVVASVLMAPNAMAVTRNLYNEGCNWTATQELFYTSDARGITGKTNNTCQRYTQVQVSAIYSGSRKYSGYRTGKTLSQINWVPPSIEGYSSTHKLCSTSNVNDCATTYTQ